MGNLAFWCARRIVLRARVTGILDSALYLIFLLHLCSLTMYLKSPLLTLAYIYATWHQKLDYTSNAQQNTFSNATLLKAI